MSNKSTGVYTLDIATLLCYYIMKLDVIFTKFMNAESIIVIFTHFCTPARGGVTPPVYGGLGGTKMNEYYYNAGKKLASHLCQRIKKTAEYVNIG
jgi:hypothetical protein